jgi:hypothetical protein
VPAPTPDPIPDPAPEPYVGPLIGIYFNGVLQDTTTNSDGSISLNSPITLICCDYGENMTSQYLEIENYTQDEIWISTNFNEENSLIVDSFEQAEVAAGQSIRVNVDFTPKYDPTSFETSVILPIEFEVFTSDSDDSGNILLSEIYLTEFNTHFQMQCSALASTVLGTWTSINDQTGVTREFELFENGSGSYVSETDLISWSIFATDNAVVNGNFGAGCVLEINGIDDDVTQEFARTSLLESLNNLTVYSPFNLTTPLIRYTR